MECLKGRLLTSQNVGDVRYKLLSNASEVKTVQRTGRNNVTTPPDDRVIIRTSIRNRRKTSSELCAIFTETITSKISSRTVQRRFVDSGLKGCKARNNLWISEANKKKRLQ